MRIHIVLANQHVQQLQKLLVLANLVFVREELCQKRHDMLRDICTHVLVLQKYEVPQQKVCQTVLVHYLALLRPQFSGVTFR